MQGGPGIAPEVAERQGQGMGFGSRSLDDVWAYLESIGVTGPAGAALLNMAGVAGALLFGFLLYRRYRTFRVGGGFRGIRTRRQVRKLRASGQLTGEFTFSDAAELAQTGTIRKKTFADKIVASVVEIEIFFRDTEHHLIYQLEMQYRSEKEVAAWIEVATALRLPDIARILREVALMRDVLYHPDYDPEYLTGGQSISDKLWMRALELHEEFKRIDGAAQLRSASEFYLRQNARHMLPLPTW